MKIYFVLIAMLFCHVLDDYKLQQGTLYDLKQKDWWITNAPENMYKYDYLMACFMHSVSWSFVMMAPIAIYYKFNIDTFFVIAWITNVAVHFVIDNAKANQKIINLIMDQIAHMLQIICTWTLLVLLPTVL